MSKSFYNHIDHEIEQILNDDLYKNERFINSPQQTAIKLKDGKEVMNFCANDYLGLANNKEIKDAATTSIQEDGFGMASVRFICGTNDLHRKLEKKLSSFLGFDDCILYVACFDANGGLFEPLFGAEDAIISDSLNHASIIDGIRLCKAKRYRYQHSDMKDLEKCLQQADSDSANHKVIVSDGVFSMDGTYAKLDKIVELAEKYNALVMLDDCHATGFIGKMEEGQLNILVLKENRYFNWHTWKSSWRCIWWFYMCKRKCNQTSKTKSRPYLFSNALSPSIVSASIKALEIVKDEPERRERIKENTIYFRDSIKSLGFE